MFTSSHLTFICSHHNRYHSLRLPAHRTQVVLRSRGAEGVTRVENFDPTVLTQQIKSTQPRFVQTHFKDRPAHQDGSWAKIRNLADVVLTHLRVEDKEGKMKWLEEYRNEFLKRKG